MGNGRQGIRLQRRKATQREERHIGNALPPKLVDKRVVGAMCQVVVVLHTDDLGDALRLRHLGGGALEPVLEPWWPSFTGPYLYYPGRRHLPAPLRMFIDFIRSPTNARLE